MESTNVNIAVSVNEEKNEDRVDGSNRVIITDDTRTYIIYIYIADNNVGLSCARLKREIMFKWNFRFCLFRRN